MGRQIDETGLLWKARRGDLTSFNRLVEKYQSDVYAFCRHMSGCDTGAEMITSDVIRQAWRKIGEYNAGSFRCWLLRQSWRSCRRALCNRKAPACGVNTRSAGKSVSGSFDEARAQLQDLSPEQRLAVVLADILGLRYEEIAETTGWSLKVTSNHLSHARAALRDALLKLNHYPCGIGDPPSAIDSRQWATVARLMS